MNSARRVAVLDSIRGIAAATVVVHHCLVSLPLFWGAYEGTVFTGQQVTGVKLWLLWVWTYTPVHLAWGGHEAVILFFVLSGYVLSLPYIHHKGLPYPAYVIKRFFRIYVPYFVVSVAGIALMVAFVGGRIDGASSWLNRYWQVPASWTMFMDHALMLGRSMGNANPVTWSLIHEMRISLVFPAIAYLVLRFRPIPVLLGAAALSLTVYFVRSQVPLPQNFYDTLHYTAFFIVGAVTAKCTPALSEGFRRLSAAWRWAVLVGALFLLNWRWMFQVGFLGNHRVAEWLMSVGSVLIIILSTSSAGADRQLGRPVFLWLGRISYSLYLVHVIILLGLYHLLNGLVQPGWIALATPFVAVTVATALHRWLEEPTIALGHRLAQCFGVGRPRSHITENTNGVQL